MPKDGQPNALCKVSPVGVRVMLWIFSFSGFVLSCLAVSSCRFIKRSTYSDAGNISVSFVGLFNFFRNSICVPSSLLSSPPGAPGSSSSLKAARAFGVLAPLIGGVTTLWMLFSIMFTGTSRPLWITMASLLITSTVFQLIVFIAFNDEGCKDQHEPNSHTYVNCSIDEGSAFAISAALFYLLTSIAMFFVAPPRAPLISFEEGWRVKSAGSGAGAGDANNKVAQAHTSVVVHRDDGRAANVSSTSPPMESFPNTNLRQVGASVSSRGSDERVPMPPPPPPQDAKGDKFGVEL